MCQHGSLLRSPALTFNEDRFQQELVRERTEKDSTPKQNSISPTKSSDSEELKPAVSSTAAALPPASTMKLISPREKSSRSKGETYYLGDFVYVESSDEKQQPMIICIESFEREENEEYFSGLQFLRPNETFHSPTQKFLRQEVFLSQSVEHIPMNQIQGLCYVSYIKDYFKYQPILQDQSSMPDEDVYVCESRYNNKTKMFKKVKWWNLPENKRIKLSPRDVPLENIRVPSTLANNLVHRLSTAENESMHTEIIEKTREIVLYDAVVNEKLNENSTVKRNFYEQIALSINRFYKVGDFVYVNQLEKKRSILKIEKIWKDNE